MKLTLEYTKSIEENAAVYFDKAKKAKKKLAGLQEAYQKTLAKHKTAQKDTDSALALSKQERQFAQAKAKKEWYEKFRWFFTTGGLLAVGGRDAHSNEAIVKKHVQKEDIVFHTDMAGSPFFVLKGGQDASDADKSEVAQATVSYSRAWGKGLGSTDVFWVLPDQITKEAQTGESLSTGAFMVRGKTNYVDVDKLEIALGVKEFKIIGGPVSSIRKQSEKVVVVGQGDKKPSEIAKLVRKKLGGHVDDIIRMLPTGGMRLI